MFASACVFLLLLTAQPPLHDDKLTSDQLPEAVRAAVQKQFPRAEISSAVRTSLSDKVMYELMIKPSKGLGVQVLITTDGKITRTVTYWDRVRTDYGQPVAQFEANKVARDAGKYLHKKITIQGEVIQVDVTNPRHCLVHMKPGIVFDFLEMKQAALSCKVGQTVRLDGVVQSQNDQQVLLSPAALRDPTASFDPLKR